MTTLEKIINTYHLKKRQYVKKFKIYLVLVFKKLLLLAECHGSLGLLFFLLVLLLLLLLGGKICKLGCDLLIYVLPVLHLLAEPCCWRPWLPVALLFGELLLLLQHSRS